MADEMKIEYMALSELLRTERNPKKHDLPALRASMLRWGFAQPLAIDERTKKIVEGHGRIEVLQAMKQAGGKPPLRVTAKAKEWMVPVVRGLSFANDQEAEAYLIAANQLTTAGGWDDQLLGSMLAQLQQANVSFEGLGFDQGTITSMLSSFAPSAEQLASMPMPVAPSFASPPAPVPVIGELPPAITPAAAVTSIPEIVRRHYVSSSVFRGLLAQAALAGAATGETTVTRPAPTCFAKAHSWWHPASPFRTVSSLSRLPTRTR